MLWCSYLHPAALPHIPSAPHCTSASTQSAACPPRSAIPGEQRCHQLPAPGSPRVSPGAPTLLAPTPSPWEVAPEACPLFSSLIRTCPLGKGDLGGKFLLYTCKDALLCMKCPIPFTASGDLWSGEAEMLHSDSGTILWLQWRTCKEEGGGGPPASLLPPMPTHTPKTKTGKGGAERCPRNSKAERWIPWQCAAQGPSLTARGPCPVLHHTTGSGVNAGAR